MDHQAKCHPPQISLLSLSPWHTHTPSITLGLGKFPGGSLIETKVPWDQRLPKAWSQDPRMICCGFGSPGWGERGPSSEGSGVYCWLPLP